MENKGIYLWNVMGRFWMWTVMLAVTSCTPHSGLEQSLRLAGTNRAELEKVLEHYREDPLKLEAAEFLIRNMPAHYSYASADCTAEYYDAIDSVSLELRGKSREYMDSVYGVLSQEYSRRLHYTSDIRVMRADYLIANIDHAFQMWQNGSWATHVSFDDFCEYLLPYKVTELQELDDWRLYMQGRHASGLDRLSLCGVKRHSAFEACLLVSDRMRAELHPLISFDNAALPVRRMRSLAQKHIGTCEDYSILALGVLRSKGIPVAIDFIHQWPFQSLNHTWCVLLDNTGKHVVFDAASSGPGKTSLPAPLGKVYRRTYAINRAIAEIHRKDRYVPRTFQRVCMKDVTDEYMLTDDVKLSLENVPKGSHYAYLAVFDNKDWIPVHYGKISGRKVTFTDMGRGVVYLPVCWDENGLRPVGDPFILTLAGEVKPLKADATRLQTIRLARKYWANRDAVWAAERAQYGRIQASDYEDFREVCDVFTIEDIPVVAGEILPDTLQRPYRYWRYFGNWHTNCNIAELNFFPAGSDTCNTGRIIGTPGSYGNSPHTTREAAFDGNSLTFFDAPLNSEGWVGMDFGRPVNMERINYTPRGDGNCVDIGHEYELVYWACGRWNSAGRRTAGNVYLDYEVPVNALFLLHNHTTGVQERIFTYENGKQIWW